MYYIIIIVGWWIVNRLPKKLWIWKIYQFAVFRRKSKITVPIRPRGEIQSFHPVYSVHKNDFRQLFVDGVAGILDGYHTGVFLVGNHRDGLAARYPAD